MATYEFRQGGKTKSTSGHINTPVEGKKAQIVGERLEQIRLERGVLTARYVVADAVSDESPLHDYFEWNDPAAADKWRLDQARHLINAVHVVTRSDVTNETVVARAFISVDKNEDARYEPLAVVLNDAALYAQVCRRAIAELEAFQDRYAQFQSLKSIGKAAHDAARAELQQVISSAETAA